jgi:hypothetical protein
VSPTATTTAAPTRHVSFVIDWQDGFGPEADAPAASAGTWDGTAKTMHAEGLQGVSGNLTLTWKAVSPTDNHLEMSVQPMECSEPSHCDPIGEAAAQNGTSPVKLTVHMQGLASANAIQVYVHSMRLGGAQADARQDFRVQGTLDSTVQP